MILLAIGDGDEKYSGSNYNNFDFVFIVIYYLIDGEDNK